MIGGGGGGVLSLIDLGLIGGIPAVAVAVALVLVRRTKVRQRGASTTVQVVAKGNRCPNCASENPSENVYCEKCGTKLG
jgi:Zn finger protein HypA/HybF involved in hydrogenase expression